MPVIVNTHNASWCHITHWDLYFVCPFVLYYSILFQRREKTAGAATDSDRACRFESRHSGILWPTMLGRSSGIGSGMMATVAKLLRPFATTRMRSVTATTLTGADVEVIHAEHYTIRIQMTIA